MYSFAVFSYNVNDNILYIREAICEGYGGIAEAPFKSYSLYDIASLWQFSLYNTEMQVVQLVFNFRDTYPLTYSSCAFIFGFCFFILVSTKILSLSISLKFISTT